MARTIKEHEYAEKRDEIINAALRLVYTKGYERMTVNDILAELNISSGAFYHYFDSKPAVLEALIDRVQKDSEKPLLPILHDPHLTALEKLQRFLSTLDTLRQSHQSTVVEMLRVWYNDDNAIVRQKVEAALAIRRAEMLAQIVRQGVQEGAFSAPFTDQAGEILHSLLQGMGNVHARLLLGVNSTQDEQQAIQAIIAAQDAFMLAIERTLGAPPQSLYRPDSNAVKVWLAALQQAV